MDLIRRHTATLELYTLAEPDKLLRLAQPTFPLPLSARLRPKQVAGAAVPKGATKLVANAM